MSCAGISGLKKASAMLLIVSAIACAQMHPGDRRKAYGNERASIIESLLTTLYPRAVVQWDPDLTVQFPGEKPRMVQVPVYVKGSATTGGLEGVATVEFEGLKERYIFEAKGFQRAAPQKFSTVLIVFRADRNGRIETYKKLNLDPSEPLTEIKTITIQDWKTRNWPIIEVQYDTHRQEQDSFTTIEWHSVIDTETEHFVSRLPFGLTRSVKGEPEQSYAFSINRTGPNTLLVGDRFGKAANNYECSDPCVVDAQKLLTQWKR